MIPSILNVTVRVNDVEKIIHLDWGEGGGSGGSKKILWDSEWPIMIEDGPKTDKSLRSVTKKKKKKRFIFRATLSVDN